MSHGATEQDDVICVLERDDAIRKELWAGTEEEVVVHGQREHPVENVSNEVEQQRGKRVTLPEATLSSARVANICPKSAKAGKGKVFALELSSSTVD